MAGSYPPEVEVEYTIGDNRFNVLMMDLRCILADHPDHNDILLGHYLNPYTTRRHPLLAKPLAEKPARCIHIRLQEQDNETSSTTLVMRDDNVDVMGFRNKRGDWYELGYQRMLPQEYRSKLLGWGNSYKSILGVRNAAEVIDILTSANLGKTFATRAVRVLSRFPAVADDDNPRLAVVGLMFVVSESARLNPVHNAIACGWNTGTGFTEKLMTDHVWKYVEMSRRLMHWKKGNYSEPQPTSELRDIYLVLNEEYMVGDLLSFAYPEMLKVSFPEMFMVPYTVEVNLRRVNNNDISSVCGKIMAFIVDEHRHSVPFRVGSMLFTEESCQILGRSEASLDLVRSAVLVPPGWVLRIEVDLCIEIPDSNTAKHLKATLIFDKETLTQSQTPKGTGIKIKGTITRVEYMQDFPAQLSRPVEVKMVSGHPTVVYTIGDDVMSFTEFIMALRRILSDHPDREDIMEGHHLLNLSSTREHPLLRKTRPEQPGRWVRVKLQVVNGQGEETSSTTLVMKDDDLYVHGFFNRNNEVLYKLRDNHEDSKSLIPEDYHHHSTKDLKWGTSYASILNLVHMKNPLQQKEEIVRKLMTKNLGRRSAECAVCELSSYTDVADADDSRARLSLAALIVIVCESARMNRLHNSFAADGWMHGLGESTRQLMFDFVWKYGELSGTLREWKERNYGEPQCVSEAQAIYLVRNAVLKGRKRGGSAASQPSNPPSSGGDSMKQSREDSGPSSRPGNNNSPPGGGEDDDRMVTRRSQDNDPGESERPSQPVEADDAQGHGRPRVELLALAMHANLLVDGMEIVVFDGKRGQIIYRKDEQGLLDDKGQGGQRMVDLVLTGPYRGISAEYGCFAIKIDIPRMPYSSSWSTHRTIKWEWDCDDSNCADQVDTLQPAYHTINTPDAHEVAMVTYAVMSNALEATVQIMLRLTDGHTPDGVQGKITARIQGFQVGSVLFSRAQGMGQCFFPTDDSRFLLQLARNVVAVPCGRMLYIEVGPAY
ncbi:uncharacterized protein [Miscanthus floridulus]|uniref:uncharacterized protein n=1 Tax=Miscanthus floridulus TaxID=154761 RepID=UPI00345867C6